MKQIRRRTALLAAAALCWGIMFPEYVFTSDSYTVFVQEESDLLCTEDAEEMTGASASGGRQRTENAGLSDGAQSAEEIGELFEAVRAGKVRYRIGIYEYLKYHLFGT